MIFRCSAPGSAFSQLNADESMVVLHNLTQSCTELEPEVSIFLYLKKMSKQCTLKANHGPSQLSKDVLEKVDSVSRIRKCNVENKCWWNYLLQVAAALAGNFKTVSADTITALGSESAGLSTGQITDVPPSEIISSLSTLSAVIGWNRGQSLRIVQLLLKGNFAVIVLPWIHSFFNLETQQWRIQYERLNIMCNISSAHWELCD